MIEPDWQISLFRQIRFIYGHARRLIRPRGALQPVCAYYGTLRRNM
jgi:hypothetical protein